MINDFRVLQVRAKWCMWEGQIWGLVFVPNNLKEIWKEILSQYVKS